MTAAFQLMLNSCQCIYNRGSCTQIQILAHTHTHTRNPHIYCCMYTLQNSLSTFLLLSLSLTLCLLNLNAPRLHPHMRLEGDVYVSLGAEMGYICTRYMYLSSHLPPPSFYPYNQSFFKCSHTAAQQLCAQ